MSLNDGTQDKFKIMIQVNDLRRGNILAYNGGGLCEVFAIEGDSVGVIDDIDPTYESLINLHYVPLTDEILLKCGFVYDNEYEYYTIETNTTHDISITYPTNGCCRLLDIDYTVTIESLNQLQNLYYILTKQELKITL